MFSGSKGSTMPVSPSFLRMLLRPDFVDFPDAAMAARLDETDLKPLCTWHSSSKHGPHAARLEYPADVCLYVFEM